MRRLRQSRSTRVFSPAFPNLERAYRSGRAVVTILGDSLSRGQGAGTDGVMQAAYPLCMAARVAKNLAYLGATQGGYSLYGASPSDTYYVPATTVGSGWVADAGLASPWGATIVNSTNTNALSVTPAEPFNMLEYFNWYEPGGSGVYTIKIDGSTVDTVTAAAPSNLVGTRYRTTLGTHTVAVNRVSGSVGAIAFRVWDDTKPCLQIETAAVTGRSAHDLVLDAGYAISTIRALAKMGTNAIVIDFGGNDAVAGRTVAQFKADLKSLAGWASAAGMDVLIAIPIPGNPVDMDDTWRPAFYEVCAELGLQPPLDWHAQFVSDAYAQAAGWKFDGYHANALGYTLLGDALTRRIMGR